MGISLCTHPQAWSRVVREVGGVKPTGSPEGGILGPNRAWEGGREQDSSLDGPRRNPANQPS